MRLGDLPCVMLGPQSLSNLVTMLSCCVAEVRGSLYTSVPTSLRYCVGGSEIMSAQFSHSVVLDSL